MASDTAYQRTKKRVKEWGRPYFNAIRIPWFLGWTIAGIAYAIDYLVKYEWHHAMIMWVIPMFIGLLSLVRLYQAIMALVTVRQWLREEDDDAARAELDEIQRHTHIVPPWTRSAFHEKRATLARPARR